MKILLVLLFLPFLAFGENHSDFDKLIDETNHYLNEYSRLTPFGDNYLPISSFGLSQKEVEELVNDADYGAMLTENKDSVESYYMIFYFQEKIVERINKIVSHPNFKNVNIRDLITSGELSIIVSDDNKLFNFTLPEKTGGSYRSRISIMHYTEFEPEDRTQKAELSKFFSSDGYSNIYTLNTDEGTKYVLTGHVRGCNYCFQSFVRLISFKDNKFSEEFMYSVENRDWNDGVSYHHETKTILVDYHIDDLTTHCYCDGKVQDDDINYDELAHNKTSVNCRCKFVFNGSTFELVEESYEKVDIEDRRD